SFLLSPPTPFSTLSLHDALPISSAVSLPSSSAVLRRPCPKPVGAMPRSLPPCSASWQAACSSRPWRGSSTRSPSAPSSTPWAPRSEEHTSELQSRENLVCRLLLE